MNVVHTGTLGENIMPRFLSHNESMSNKNTAWTKVGAVLTDPSEKIWLVATGNNTAL